MKNRLPMSPHLLRSSMLLAALALAGCGGSILESKKVDYKSSGRLPSLEVPPDLTAPGRDERYVVPEAGKGSATFSSYVEERSGAVRSAGVQDILPQIGKLHMERAGTQRWLVVPGTPEKLWPVLKEFWQQTGLTLSLELPEAGIMETDWAENRAKLPMDFIRNALGKALDTLYSTAERDKFRTRLEKGGEPGTTEIYVSHRGMYEIYVNEGHSDTRWQPRPADPELEAEMLQRIMVKLGADEAHAKTLLAAQQSPDHAKLVRNAEGISVLTVQEPFDRAWRRVGLALDRVGFTVEDRDRAQGVYFVRYVDPEADQGKKEEKGFLSKLMFWKSDSPEVKPSAQFRIAVKGEGTASVVQVHTREGGAEKSETAAKILGLLFNQLK